MLSVDRRRGFDRQDVAGIYRRSLGREIRYGGNDLELWEKKATRTLPDWLVHDLTLMYEFFQRHGLRASEEGFALQAKVLGHLPRSFHAFVGETIAAMGARWVPRAREGGIKKPDPEGERA